MEVAGVFTENPMAAQKDDMADIVAEDSNAALLPNWFERTLRVVRKPDGAPTALARAVPALTAATIMGCGYYCLFVRLSNFADPGAFDMMLISMSSTFSVPGVHGGSLLQARAMILVYATVCHLSHHLFLNLWLHAPYVWLQWP